MARLKKQVALTLDPAFLARVDAARGDVSRNRFIERALEEALGAAVTDSSSGATMSGGTSPASPRGSSEPRRVPVGVEMAQRRVSGHVRPPIPKKGS